MEKFADLLFDLGKILGVNLYAEKGIYCRINYAYGFDVQLELEDAKERILIASFLCDVPPGAYREMLFKSALKANGTYPNEGSLAYSERNNKLVLFTYAYLIQLKAEKFAAALEKFTKKAHDWKEAVEKNRPLPVSLEEPKKGSIFDLGPK
ncbi:MAG TPA: CesT family type III secretion system chaperone [Rhabdochlamydiaceae bacterium]|nr:CesT family type III secretion system chaperone [Rhabdochlamydiaceae bacterium]